ncbi:MAG: PQQ-dependent sugar dehydrogenase [Pirellulales bacterium]
MGTRGDTRQRGLRYFPTLACGITGRVFALALFAVACVPAATTHAQLSSLRVEDYATLPMTGLTAFPASTGSSGYLARVNFMADDPADSNRFLVNDLNGPLYFLDKSTRQFTQYLNFNGTGRATGLFDRLYFNEGGFAAGFITFEFDPDYAHNGKFYTVHMESGTSGSQVPTHPNLDASNFGPTASVDAPGNSARQVVLAEWTDTNINNSTFEGTARELLRMDARDRIHPLGDIIFNPTAGPDDPDWRVMYLSVGDAGNGEQSDPAIRRTPQQLSALGGKILRIMPDLAGGNTPSTVSPNGKYRIPDDNPFTGIADANVRDEIYALGLRNPHRMSWDVDPADPNNNHLIVSDIGLFTWEEVNIIHKGGNYGYSTREGNQLLSAGGAPPLNATGPIPNPDAIPNELICAGPAFTACTSNGTVTPLYPVLQYGHGLAGQDQLLAGDSISDGFVYRGTKIPELVGKFIFGDITTGVLYYADFAEMLAADDGDPATLAAIHALELLWDNPNDGPDAGEVLYGTLTTDDAIRGPLFQIVESAYHARGGLDPNLPGGANVTGVFGRADVRLQVDATGELYVLSKSDGMIRALLAPVPEPATAWLAATALAMSVLPRRRCDRAR